jgi:amino acid transporter
MYIIGFCEVFTSVFPFLIAYRKIIEVFFLTLIFIPTIKGADVASKVQFLILFALIASFIVFFLSAIIKFDITIFSNNLMPEYLSGNHFWLMFALFFPAVTGFTQGVSLSGVLKNPQKSITLGTFLAVITGFFLYLFTIVLLSGNAERNLLLTDYSVMTHISIFPIFITIGVFASTISSALGSFMGAPHILFALSKDKLLPFIDFFSVGSKKTGEPRRAVILTYLIALVAIIMADLNTIAPIITMFFLISYGMMNYSNFIESYSKNPSFRPSFKYNHWLISLIGVVVIIFVMVLIDFVSAVVAFLLLFSLYNYLSRRKLQEKFKDSRTGYYFQKIKEYLIKLQNQPIEIKNWRPQIMVLTGNPTERLDLIKFSKFIEADRGNLSLVRIIENYDGANFLKIRSKAEKELFEFIRNEHISILGDVVLTDNYVESIKVLVQSYGFHGIRPNTVLLGWSDKTDKDLENYLKIIRFANKYGKNVIIYDGKMAEIFDKDKKVIIDVWWRGENNGGLMLMLAHLMSYNKSNNNVKIRLVRTVSDKLEIKVAQEELRKLLIKFRLEAEIAVIFDEDNVSSIIINYSKEADFVFLGLSLGEDNSDFLLNYKQYRNNFKNIILVKSSDKIKLEE